MGRPAVRSLAGKGGLFVVLVRPCPPRVIRLSILGQGGAWRRRSGTVPMQPQALARGVRPPAGPRTARGCERTLHDERRTSCNVLVPTPILVQPQHWLLERDPWTQL